VFVSHFFSFFFFCRIGNNIFSLDQIEHVLLRRNSKPPEKFIIGKIPFLPGNSENERIMKFSVNRFDPRIHFALNCSAKSCPSLRVYWVENIDSALSYATKEYLGENVKVNVEENSVVLSKLFKWYKMDFGEKEGWFYCG